MRSKAHARDVVSKPYPDGRTALHLAVSREADPIKGKSFQRSLSLEVLSRSLISFGADVNAKDAHGMTPLHLAAARGDINSIKLLLNAGANPNAVTNDGDSVLYVATYWEHIPAIRMLIRWGADPSIANARGNTPRTMAIKDKKPSSVVEAVAATRCCPRRAWCIGDWSCLKA